MKGKAAGIDLALQLEFKTFSAIRARGLLGISRAVLLYDFGIFCTARFLNLHRGRIGAEGLSGQDYGNETTNDNRFVFVLPQRP